MTSLSGRLLVAIESVNRTREDFAEVENGVERLRKARLAASRVVLEEQRAQRFLTQAYKAQHQQFMDTISVMRNVGYIGRSVLTMWQAYTLGQMRVEQSLKSVAEAQIWVNTTMELYGENSVYYQDAVSDLEDLEAAAEKAKGDETAGLIGLGLTAVGVAAQVGSLLAKLELLGAVGPISIALGFGAGLKAIGESEYYTPPDPDTPPIMQVGSIDFNAMFLDFMKNFGISGWGSGSTSIVQINYGVEGAQESISSLEEALTNLLTYAP